MQLEYKEDAFMEKCMGLLPDGAYLKIPPVYYAKVLYSEQGEPQVEATQWPLTPLTPSRPSGSKVPYHFQ